MEQYDNLYNVLGIYIQTKSVIIKHQTECRYYTHVILVLITFYNIIQAHWIFWISSQWLEILLQLTPMMFSWFSSCNNLISLSAVLLIPSAASTRDPSLIFFTATILSLFHVSLALYTVANCREIQINHRTTQIFVIPAYIP